MATTDGVVRAPSWLTMTTGCPPSMTATTEFVVPRSMPITFAMLMSPPFRVPLETDTSLGSRLVFVKHIICVIYTHITHPHIFMKACWLGELLFRPGLQIGGFAYTQ